MQTSNLSGVAHILTKECHKGSRHIDEPTYKQWWLLHRRSAVGELLSAEEQARYEAGLRQLEAEEPPIQSSIDALRQARQQMLAAQAEYRRLQRQYEAMQAEAAALEARLDKSTKQVLGIRK